MGRGPHWGTDEIEHVKELLAANKGPSKIARATQRSVNSVQKLLGRLRKGEDLTVVKPRGRKRAFNARQREQLDKWVQDHPADSIANVRARMLQVWEAEGEGDGSAGPSRSTFSRAMAQTTRPLKPTRVQKLVVFVQDNAPSHVSKATRAFLARLWPHAEILAQPPQSPDLNPLDFGVWSQIEQKMPEKHLNKAELIGAVAKAALAASEGSAALITHSFVRRRRACVASNGGHFEHLLG